MSSDGMGGPWTLQSPSTYHAKHDVAHHLIWHYVKVGGGAYQGTISRSVTQAYVTQTTYDVYWTFL
jgi:hypothetical protein